MFSISSESISTQLLNKEIQDHRSGAVVVFEGVVRNHNQGLDVKSLEYQIYHELALKEGKRILTEAKEKFNVHHIMAVHREGHLALGDIAVWIGATSSHRDDAFKATRYIIDEIKHRLPIWKKEHYLTADAKWVFCQDHHHHIHFLENDFYKKQLNVIDQNKLKNASVLIVGIGGLGSPAAANLVLAGVGKILIVDFDKVSLDNLHRQFLFRPQHIGESKVKVASSLLKEMNPFVEVKYIEGFFKSEHLKDVDLVIDGTDNMRTKYQIHDACLNYRVPLISGGLFKHDAQVRTMIPGDGCWRCLELNTPDDGLIGNCNDSGTIGAWASTVGSILATEAIEFLSSGSNSTTKETLHFNLKKHTNFRIRNVKSSDCVYCSGDFEVLDSKFEVEDAYAPDLLDIRHLTDKEVFHSILGRERVVLCCHRGNRSLKLAHKFRDEGHKNVFSLKGGALNR